MISLPRHVALAVRRSANTASTPLRSTSVFACNHACPRAAPLRTRTQPYHSPSHSIIAQLQREVVQPRPFTGTSLPLWPLPKPPSVLQILASHVARATHRSGAYGGRSSYGFEPPRGRGPWAGVRDAINAIPNNVLFWGVLVVNGFVFVTWNYAISTARNTNDKSLYIWMHNNFTTSMRNFREGRIWTIITASFSHQGTAHLAMNLFTYYFMAPPVLAALGNVGFLGLYLGGGIVCSLTSMFWHNAVKHVDKSSCGASGAIYSVVTFFACVAPQSKFYLFAILPLPAWLCVSGIFLIDGYSAVYDKQAGTDTAGHIGGILGGIAFFLAKRFRLF